MKPPLKGYSTDNYQTPAFALDPLIPFLPKRWVVWEPAQGKGNLVRALDSRGYRVIGTDILDGQDFLSWQPDHYDCVVTNPPFSIKHKFLYRAYMLGKPFAFLLPLTTLETRTRQAYFKEYGVEIIVFDKRIDFVLPNGDTGRSWFNSAWFTNGLNLGRQLTFVQYDGHNPKRF